MLFIASFEYQRWKVTEYIYSMLYIPFSFSTILLNYILEGNIVHYIYLMTLAIRSFAWLDSKHKM